MQAPKQRSLTCLVCYVTSANMGKGFPAVNIESESCHPMRSSLRIALSSIGLGVGRFTHLFHFRPSVRILYYHSVSNLPVRSSVAPEMFAAQMEYLQQQAYRVLTFTEAIAYLSGRHPIPEKSIVLTFDDGFLDNYEHAFPVLERFRFPAIIFLAAAYIGSDRLPTLTRTDFVPQPLTWEHVQAMHARGVEFGSHSLSHPMLSRVSPQEVRKEVAESKRLIQEKLGAPVQFFCYPRGEFSSTVKNIVREEGYQAACSIVPGVNGWNSDLFALRRTYISRRDSIKEFSGKISGLYDFMQLVGHVWWHFRNT